jgi:hypothetical protein
MNESQKGVAMTSQQSTQGNSQAAGSNGKSQQDDASVTLGIGGVTSGEAGATPTHETMAETGGSGGSGLTRNQSGQGAGAGAATERGAGESATDSGARGFQDTRGNQAGGSATGLGTPETGANQTPADLEHKR